MATFQDNSTQWYGLGRAMKECAVVGVLSAGVGPDGRCEITNTDNAVFKASTLLKERLGVRPPMAVVECLVYSAIEDISDAGHATLYLGQGGSLRAYLLIDVCLGE